MKFARRFLAAVIPLIGLSAVGCTVYETAPPNTVAVVQNPAPAPPPPPPAAAAPAPDSGPVVVSDAPPPDQVEVVGVAPWPNAYWIHGYYVRRGPGWYWVGGYWAHRPYRGAVWVRPYYRPGPHGYVYVGGYWR